MGHVFARLVGHGLVLLPHYPYEFARHPSVPEAVEVTHLPGDTPLRTVVDPAAARTVPGVVDVEPGPDHPYWIIETTGFKVAWPEGFTISSSSDPFCLWGEDDALIFIQGPAPVEDPARLVGPGQTLLDRRRLDRGLEALQLAYTHEGEPWRQGVYLFPRAGDRFLVFTAQSRERSYQETREALEWMLGIA